MKCFEEIVGWFVIPIYQFNYVRVYSGQGSIPANDLIQIRTYLKLSIIFNICISCALWIYTESFHLVVNRWAVNSLCTLPFQYQLFSSDPF